MTLATPLITLDIDWAPDFIIESVAQQLIDKKVKATWFVTHDTPVLQKLRKYTDLFELGIHPNINPGSTQGKTPKEVLSYLMSIVPEAISLRTHGLVQSTNFLDLILSCTPVKYDVSTFMQRADNVRPYVHRHENKNLTRYIFGWEDDLEMRDPAPVWNFKKLSSIYKGRWIMNFHPIHIYLNSCDMTGYEKVKKLHANINDVTPSEIAPFRRKGEGAATLFSDALSYLSQHKTDKKIKELEAAL